MHNPIASFLDRFTLKKPILYKGLVVFPVCLTGGAPADEEEIISLEEGLKSGRISVAETGRMERIGMWNAGHTPALIMDGETLLGGAQNRVMNTSVVLRPGEHVETPASCVEVHRWDLKRDGEIPQNKRKFNTSDMAFAKLRHSRMEDMHNSITTENRVSVDQNEVWRTIIQRFGIVGAKADTLDLHDLYDCWHHALKVFTDRFHLVTAQTGMISFLNRRTWFADIFAHRTMLMKQYKKILKGIAFDALIRLDAKGELPLRHVPTADDARDVLRNLRVAKTQLVPMGRDFYLASDKCFGFAAVYENKVLYLSACSRHFSL
ncbi:MAG: DUF6569 family protein [bacterium]